MEKRLKQLMDQYEIKNQNWCRRWFIESSITMEECIRDYARVEKMKFIKSPEDFDQEKEEISNFEQEEDFDNIRWLKETEEEDKIAQLSGIMFLQHAYPIAKLLQSPTKYHPVLLHIYLKLDKIVELLEQTSDTKKH